MINVTIGILVIIILMLFIRDYISKWIEERTDKLIKRRKESEKEYFSKLNEISDKKGAKNGNV